MKFVMPLAIRLLLLVAAGFMLIPMRAGAQDLWHGDAQRYGMVAEAITLLALGVIFFFAFSWMAVAL